MSKYMECKLHQRYMLKKGRPQWPTYPPFQAHSATQVCTGIRQNQFLFKTTHSLHLETGSTYKHTHTHIYMLASEWIVLIVCLVLWASFHFRFHTSLWLKFLRLSALYHKRTFKRRYQHVQTGESQEVTLITYDVLGSMQNAVSYKCLLGLGFSSVG